MARISYLLRRGATYYARTKVPVDLIDVIGKRELVKTLGTKDENEAKRLLWPVVEAWNRHFDDMRSRRMLTTDDKADAVWQHYTGTLERDDQARQQMPTTADIEAATEKAVERVQREGIDVRDPLAALDASLDVMVLKQRRTLDAQARQAKLDAMRKHLVEGETTLIAHEVQDYIDRNKLLIDPLSPDRADLAGKLMRSEIEGLERTLERDRGDYTGTPRDPIVKPATGTSREQAKPGETIMELFEQYAVENPKGIATDTIAQARRDVGSFVDFVGSTCPVHRIDKKAVREWKALLMKYPVKATESSAFAGMKLAQIVRHNEQIGKPVITARTVNRYLAGFSAFCSWLVNHGYLDQNPADGMFLKKTKGNKPLVFTSDQLNTLFKSPLFTGCQSADEWRNISKPGNVRIRDHRYWVPLVMLFSGARPAEVAQLAVQDVRKEHGHWIMHITDEGDDKSVKTEGSMRVVPVHPELIRLGFIKYRDGMEAAGQQRLFPHAERNSRGQMIADFSREFGRYLTRLGMKVGRGLSLYSFRHGAADAFRRAGYLDEQFGPIVLGHSSASMTGRYGMMPQGMLEQRVEYVNAIAYPGLKIDHLV